MYLLFEINVIEMSELCLNVIINRVQIMRLILLYIYLLLLLSLRFKMFNCLDLLLE